MRTTFKVMSKTELPHGFNVALQVCGANSAPAPVFNMGVIPKSVADDLRVGCEYELAFTQVFAKEPA